MTSPAADRSTRPVIGEWVDGIDIPVVNERAVRASAGILFLLGFSAWLSGVITGDLQYMRGFGILFAAEMFLRLFVGTRFTPTLLIGTLITNDRQRHIQQLLPPLGAGKPARHRLCRLFPGVSLLFLASQSIAPH